MFKATVLGFGLALAGAVYLQAAAGPIPTSALAQSAASVQDGRIVTSPERALLERYCITCHNDKAAAQGTVPISLQGLDLSRVAADAETWEKVVQRVRTRTMPPAGSRRPDAASHDSFAVAVEAALDRNAALNPNPGRVTVHRLNQVEYTNAIRDLLHLEIDGRSMLPADESGYGFDNIADVLSFSPVLLERYLIAAQKVSRQAVGDLSVRPIVTTHRVSPFLRHDNRMSNELPFGSRGGTVLHHYFPADGEYTLRIRLRRNFTNSTIRAIATRETIDVLLDGARVTRFAIGAECNGSKEPRCLPVGSSEGYPSEYERTADDGLFVRFSAKAGPRVLGVTFVKSNAEVEGARPSLLPPRHSSSTYEAERMSVDFVQLEGPFNPTGLGDTPPRRAIFVCRPTSAHDEEPCARTILARLGRRAYRRPVADREVDTLVEFYRSARRDGTFDAGIQAALSRLLVSPNFLLRVVRAPQDIAPGRAYRITDLELASRLSFFLWSSIPDDELIDVAARAQLQDPQVLEAQVRRMLADRRATSLVNNFAGQWLALRNLRSVQPDPQVYPDFDDDLREGFRRETELFVESQMREDRPLPELLTANYTFLNERVASFYKIPHVYGTHFRRVSLSGHNRAGLLAHGAILTVTSYSTRTSPVVRGRWLLDNVLGAPPPPPPPDVPPLDEGEKGKPAASMRERMEQHRTNPVCASCHTRMDPMGFALENFDGIGKWRTTEASMPIDAAGAFPDGTRFSGPDEFRQVLIGHPEQFVRTFIEKLLTYALGRGLETYDRPAVRAILTDSAANDYRWSSIILGIVRSRPFQMSLAADTVPAQQ